MTEAKNQSQIALINMNGLKNEIVMKALRREIMKQRIEVLFVTEPLMLHEKQAEIQRIFQDFDVFFRHRKEKDATKYSQRGGIMCIAKKGAVKLERECRSDDLMFVDWRGVTVACAYFVPLTSPYAKYNEKRMIELQERVLECSNEVLILTDSNAWIGEAPSEVSKLQDGYERETHTFTRTSEKKESNKQGEQFLTSMNR